MELKRCNNCFKEKPLNQFSLNSNRKPRNICNKCRSTKYCKKAQEKKLDQHPEQYYQCDNDDCMWIWHRRYGRTCKKCGSEAAEI